MPFSEPRKTEEKEGFFAKRRNSFEAKRAAKSAEAELGPVRKIIKNVVEWLEDAWAAVAYYVFAASVTLLVVSVLLAGWVARGQDWSDFLALVQSKEGKSRLVWLCCLIFCTILAGGCICLTASKACGREKPEGENEEEEESASGRVDFRQRRKERAEQRKLRRQECFNNLLQLVLRLMPCIPKLLLAVATVLLLIGIPLLIWIAPSIDFSDFGHTQPAFPFLVGGLLIAFCGLGLCACGLWCGNEARKAAPEEDEESSDSELEGPGQKGPGSTYGSVEEGRGPGKFFRRRQEEGDGDKEGATDDDRSSWKPGDRIFRRKDNSAAEGREEEDDDKEDSRWRPGERLFAKKGNENEDTKDNAEGSQKEERWKPGDRIFAKRKDEDEGKEQDDGKSEKHDADTPGLKRQGAVESGVNDPGGEKKDDKWYPGKHLRERLS